MSDTEHHITVRAVHVLSGGFNASMLDEVGNLREIAEDLEFEREKSLSLECSCGERFRKFRTAADHLGNVDTATDQPGGRDE